MQTQSTHRFDPDDRYPPPTCADVSTPSSPDRVLLNLTPDLMLAGDRAQMAELLWEGIGALFPDFHASFNQLVDSELSRLRAAIADFGWDEPARPTRYRFGAMGMEEVTAEAREAARHD